MTGFQKEGLSRNLLNTFLPLLLVLFVSACGKKSEGQIGGDCQSAQDCATAHGQAEAGCEWVCSYGICHLMGTCENAGPVDPVPGSCTQAKDCQDQALPQDCPEGSWECLDGQCRPVCGDPSNSGCLADRVDLPADQNCTCECADCDCLRIDCHCDLACYGQEDCLIGVDENGNPTTSDPTLGDCNLSCTPEDDTSHDMGCSATDCNFQPNNIQLTPDENPTPGSKRMERNIKEAGMIIAVDTSGSMQPKQMASACAMDAFFEAAGNAEYTIGITTMDVIDLYGSGGAMIGDAHLVGLNGGCDVPLECDCSGSFRGNVCDMAPNGDMVSSENPGAEDDLRKLIVQGSNENSDNDEAGLEKAFRLIFELIAQGRGDEISQVVLISDEKANSDREMCPIQSHRYDPANLAALRAVLGADFNPPPNTGDCDTDLMNFYIYFFTRYGIQVNVLVDTDPGSGDYAEVYIGVAEATGGAIGDIYDCQSFVDFFRQVGTSTNTISTQLCLDEPVDPNTLEVVYIDENGQSHPVPQSATDGWSYDAALNCIVLNGSWQDVFGTFEVSYDGLEGDTSSQVCFPPGIDPLPDTIRVFYNGAEIPQSATDGWTFDPATDCITFHGSWASHPGPFDIDYL